MWFPKQFPRTPRAQRKPARRRLTVEVLEDRCLPASGLSAALVADIVPGGIGSNPSALVPVNGTLFFVADDGVHGPELYKSDGTAADTVLLKDINPIGGSNPANLTNVGGTLYFTADDGAHGTELWTSDAAGTVLVADINPGSGGSYPGQLTDCGGTLFFAASDPSNGTALWKTNGTAASTVLVKDINPGGDSSFSFLINVGGMLYFGASDPAAPSNGGQLWKSDGTADGTVLVKGGLVFGTRELAALNGSLFFRATEISTLVGGLWKSDGTPASTVLVKNLGVANLTNVNGTLFFAGNDGAKGVELWKSDGTERGTVLVKDIFTGTSKAGSPDPGGHGGGGTYPNSSSPADLTNVNGRLYFSAKDGKAGRELWTSDGTAGGTVLVKDIYPGSGWFGPNSSFPASLTNVNGLLYFTALDAIHGRELWQSDGTAAGTVMVQDINPGSAGSDPASLVAMNNKLYFSADDGTHGRELWDPPPVEPSYTLGPLVQVSTTGLFADCYTSPPGNFINTEDENYLVVDPTNSNHLVGLWHQEGTTYIDGQIVGVTFNGGTTWRLAPLPGISKCSGGTLPGVADPWLAFAPNGDLYAATLAFDIPGGNEFAGTARSQVLVSKSIDGGLSWSTPTILADDAKHSLFNDKEMVLVDPNDSNLVYVVWQQIDVPQGFGIRRSTPDAGATGGNITAVFTRSTDGGRTWEPVRTLYNPGANAIAVVNQIVVRPDGTLVDFFTETLLNKNNDGGTKFDSNVSLSRSTDHGQTWLPAGKPIRAFKMQPGLVTDPVTGNFVATDAFGTNPDFPSGNTDVAVDPHNGNLYVVWEDSRFSAGQYNGIGFSMSTDGGNTWSTPIAVNQTPTNVAPRDRQAFVPSVAVADDGTVAVTYYDFRKIHDPKDPGTNYWTVFGRPTTPTALTDPANWKTELRLSDRSFDLGKTVFLDTEFLGHYQGLSASGNNFLALFAQAVSDADPASIFFQQIIAGAPLEAASIGHNGAAATLTSQQVAALLPEAIHRWQAAGVDVPALAGLDIRIADLGGTTLGLASGHTIWLDANAAGWGWFVDRTAWEDSEFIRRGNQGEQHRMDLLTVLEHEIGHLLGQGHKADGLMAETLTAGTRRVPSSGSDLVDVAVLDRVFVDGKTSLAAPFLDGSAFPTLMHGEKQRQGKPKA